MRKDDLKNGMVVERRDGERRLVLLDTLVGMSDCEVLDFWNDNLIFGRYDVAEFDIVRVYKLKLAYPFNNLLREDNLELIWSRKEYPILTRFQHNFLKKMAGKYNWMARDGVTFNRPDAELWFYKYKPTVRNETDVCWIEPGKGSRVLDDVLDDFDFIKWEDEPWNIKELLDNCKVEE